jgi:hypothetical protein
MKYIISFISCCILCLVLVQYRVSYSGIKEDKPLMLTTWDAFGYYMYLPSLFIYNDCKELKWVAEVDNRYKATGGTGWPADKLPNGNYVFKYLGGVAVLEMPWFFTGHMIAKATGAPQDGFSPPYQYALGFGILLYGMLAIFLLRRVLLYYFNDLTVAITLLLLILATNYLQYGAIDNAQSHAPIFLLYALVLYTTLQWHRQPRMGWAALTGYIVGLATMSRPTEAIMLFIPLMWGTQNKEAAKEKWRMVKENSNHVIVAACCGLLGVLPQLLYWKSVTGSFLYDVGSKWDFANPHFRVLFGWEKGWFIYTPVTVFFIVGMFFIRKYPFRKSVLWFCLLNIYIIIAWHIWRYGGSYSTRALVQSYPVFALPFAGFVEYVNTKKWRWGFYALGAYLIVVNLFQISQYNKTVLHYDDMNRRYYGSIYLNTHPDAVDMSLLDTDERLQNERGYKQSVLFATSQPIPMHFEGWGTATITEMKLPEGAGEQWLKIESDIKAPGCLWKSYLEAHLTKGDSMKHAKVRLFSPISDEKKSNHYTFYMQVPKHLSGGTLRVYLSSEFKFDGVVGKAEVKELATPNR